MRQVFSGRRCPQTFIVTEEKKVLGFKVSKCKWPSFHLLSVTNLPGSNHHFQKAFYLLCR
jgi:hypothetical protein